MKEHYKLSQGRDSLAALVLCLGEGEGLEPRPGL